MQSLFEDLDAEELDVEARWVAGKENKYFRSEEYLALPAKDKQAEIWAEVVAQQGKTSSFPGALEFAGAFTESMAPSFETKGDAMETGFFGTRRKYIHSVGSVAKIHFRPTVGAKKYTGIFKGAKYGIVRFSTATPLAANSAMVPGMGVKFLRDGIDSANFLAMNSTEGQPDEWNFF